MSLDALVDIIHNPPAAWTDANKSVFDTLFGAPSGRYPKAAEKTMTVRAPGMSPELGVPFAAYIHPANPKSGPYGGLSFVIFPVQDGPCLVGLVVGTQGLVPDEVVLGRPGHARKVRAICDWLNREFGGGSQIAWAKQDPTRTDTTVPDDLREKWQEYKSVFDRVRERDVRSISAWSRPKNHERRDHGFPRLVICRKRLPAYEGFAGRQ